MNIKYKEVFLSKTKFSVNILYLFDPYLFFQFYISYFIKIIHLIPTKLTENWIWSLLFREKYLKIHLKKSRFLQRHWKSRRIPEGSHLTINIFLKLGFSAKRPCNSFFGSLGGFFYNLSYAIAFIITKSEQILSFKKLTRNITIFTYRITNI